jgi:hypothetical protein
MAFGILTSFQGYLIQQVENFGLTTFCLEKRRKSLDFSHASQHLHNILRDICKTPSELDCFTYTYATGVTGPSSFPPFPFYNKYLLLTTLMLGDLHMLYKCDPCNDSVKQVLRTPFYDEILKTTEEKLCS